MKSSAVMKEKTEGPVMSEPAESRIARIESHVEHLDEVTTDLRVELRRTNDKIDAGFQRLDKKVDDGHKELNKKIDDVYKELKDKLHSLSLWALLLYITLAGGLLTVIARAFKWM
jgi:chromosome segregation ATPase